MIASYLRTKLHQTRFSRGLRRVPGVSALAMTWWKSSQEREVRESIGSIEIGATWPGERPLGAMGIPQAKDLLEHDPLTIEAGRKFSAEQGAYATSKFHDLGYQYVYGRLLKGLRERPIRILEIGIGVNDPSVRSGMHAKHLPGASLRGWAHYFRGSEVHGADVDRRALVESPDFATHWVDQLSGDSLEELAAKLGGSFDLIIDDGLHTPEANAKTLTALLPILAPTGVFVVEDIMVEFDYLWLDEIPRLLGPNFRVDFFSGSLLEPLLTKPREVLSGMAVVSFNSDPDE